MQKMRHGQKTLPASDSSPSLSALCPQVSQVFYQMHFPQVNWLAISVDSRSKVLLEELKQKKTSLGLIFLSVREMQNLAQKNLLLSLDRTFPKSWLERYESSALRSCHWDKKLLGIPADVSSYGLLIRLDLWNREKLPLPHTWSDLEKSLRHFKKLGRNPSVMSPPHFFLNLLGSNGIDLASNLDTLVFRREVMEAYEFASRLEKEHEIFQGHKLSPLWKKEALIRFQKGEIPCRFMQLAPLATWSKKELEKIKVLPFPIGPSGKPPLMCLHGHAWCIPSNASDPEKSLQLLRSIQDFDFMKKLDLRKGYAFPALRALWKDREIIREKPFYAMAPQILGARKTSAPWITPSLEKIFETFIHGIRSQLPPEKLMQELSIIGANEILSRVRHPILRKAIAFIESHLKEIRNLQAVAHQVQFSMPGLHSIFKKELGTSGSDYLKLVRMKHARVLLASPHKFIKEVATEVGFDNPAAFGNSFKRYWGESPQEYRARMIR